LHLSSAESLSVAKRSRSLRSAALSGSLWTAGHRWLARLVSFGTFAVLGRLLDPEQFGLVALAASVATFMGILVDFGLPRFVVHVTAADEEVRNTVLWCSLGLGIGIGGLQAACAPLIAALLDSPTVEPVLLVMALGYPMSAMYGVLAAFQKRALRFRLLALRGIVAVIASAGLAIILALRGWGVWALVAQALAYAAVSLLVLVVADPWRPQLPWSTAVIRDAFRYGRSALGAAAMDAVTSASDGLIVGRRLGVDQLGYYSVAFRLVNVVLDLLVSVVHAVAFPILARTQDDRQLLASAYRRSVTQGVLLSAPAMALLAALMPQLISTLLGPTWASVAGVGAVLAISRGLLVPAWFDSALLYAIGRVRDEFWLCTLGAVSVVVAVTFGAFWGLTGVAVALVARSLLLWPVRMVVSCRLTGQPVLPLAMAVLRIWLAAGLSGCATLLAVQSVSSQVLAIALGFAVGTVAFVGAAALLAREDLAYLLGSARIFLEPRIAGLRKRARLGR
jgi:O-antigen/teichoic acid export membrane protein